MAVTLLAQALTSATSAASADEPSCYSRVVNDWVCGAYLRDRRSELLDALVEHLQITVVSVLAGLLVAFPLALAARRLPRL
jgi:osmoprotectant transport system permease protein